MFFLHGLGQLAASWEQTLNNLALEKEMAVCPELLQWIRQTEPTYENLYASLVRELCKETVPVNLCGLSLGGILALQYASEYPQKVNSLVLIGTQYKMPKGLLRFQNLIFRIMPKRTFESIGIGKDAFLTLTKSMMDLDFTERLKHIQCPVLIVYGEKDHANRKASIEMKNKIEHAEAAVIKGAGHEVNTEKPEALGKMLQVFYNNYFNFHR